MKKLKYYFITLAIFLISAFFLYPTKSDSYPVVCKSENIGYYIQVLNQNEINNIDDIISSKGPRTLHPNPMIDFFNSYINHSILIYPYYYGIILKNTSSLNSEKFNMGVSYIKYYAYASYPLSEQSEKSGSNYTVRIIGKVLGVLTPVIFLSLLIMTIFRSRKRVINMDSNKKS